MQMGLAEAPATRSQSLLQEICCRRVASAPLNTQRCWGLLGSPEAEVGTEGTAGQVPGKGQSLLSPAEEGCVSSAIVPVCDHAIVCLV